MPTKSLRRNLAVAVLFASACIPASATPITISITSISAPGSLVQVVNSPFILPNGTSADGLIWDNVMATVTTTSTFSNLAFSGAFGCNVACNDTFRVTFTVTGLAADSIGSVSLAGTANTSHITDLTIVNAGTKQIVTETFANTSGSFSTQSDPASMGSFGNSTSFTMRFNLQMGPGNLSVPAGSTADFLVTTAPAVPEPATFSILAACVLLFIYVKRLRRA